MVMFAHSRYVFAIYNYNRMIFICKAKISLKRFDKKVLRIYEKRRYLAISSQCVDKVSLKI